LYLPEAVISEDVATLPGLDGRKMSKSYNNTVPLFEGGSKALKSAVARIVTDSRGPGEPKDAEASHLYLIYKAFAQPAETAAFRKSSKRDWVGEMPSSAYASALSKSLVRCVRTIKS
jgi:tryptophanyl-tRNA synthetase